MWQALKESVDVQEIDQSFHSQFNTTPVYTVPCLLSNCDSGVISAKTFINTWKIDKCPSG